VASSHKSSKQKDGRNKQSYQSKKKDIESTPANGNDEISMRNE